MRYIYANAAGRVEVCDADEVPIGEKIEILASDPSPEMVEGVELVLNYQLRGKAKPKRSRPSGPLASDTRLETIPAEELAAAN